ncbi:MAG TPA: type II secretion system protein GspG, partial [Methylomirabilota bacterium]
GMVRGLFVVGAVLVLGVGGWGCQREQKAISEDLPAARATRARADALAIASAVRQYQATFQALPESIEDLTQARTVSGVSGGPFLAKAPVPPAGWSAYQYAKQGDNNFTVTSSGGGVTVTAP